MFLYHRLFLLRGGGGAHAVMMPFVFRKNSHVDYDSHTSCTCLHLCCSLGLQLFVRLCSLNTERTKTTVLKFLVQKMSSVYMLYMAESLQAMWLFGVILLLRLQIWYFDVQLFRVFSCVTMTHRNGVFLQSWGKQWPYVFVAQYGCCWWWYFCTCLFCWRIVVPMVRGLPTDFLKI